MNKGHNFLPFIEVVEWHDQPAPVMMWKVPDEDREIKNGAKLIVREGQSSMFLTQGTVADIFEAGTHVLQTENIPILSRLKGWKHGFESPFKADVFYFARKQFVSLKWGTPAPVLLRDPQFGQVRIRAFGSYNVRISNVERFFREYAGISAMLTIKDFEAKLRDYIAPKFAEALADLQVPVLDIARNFSVLNSQIEPLIQPYFEDFGVSITQFTVSSVSLPDQVNEYFDKVTGMNMVADDTARFRDFNTSLAIGSPDNSVSGDVQQGVGLGLLIKEMQSAPAAPVLPANDAAKPSSNDITASLLQLKKLFDAELIDEKEYKDKKTELLSKL
ncbi:MAG: SPFH domain-containing protein [Sphingobacterium sp.]|uniref:SPFH domain-containing protein n=1 Tax=Sphingobacterium sp. JB170 TaxID=1434842 RepID=UPI00097EF0D6|nr:SPFH domain-containing protein [Sphingobacterium sp. JB170]SJN37286.1 Putative virion core protein (lumpy skin disease virus) [Sphingobacterium sp. JB170]